MLGVQTIPALIYTIMVWGVPESPRWLIGKKNDTAAARTILHDMGVENVEEEIAAITKQKEQQIAKGESTAFFKGKYKAPILLAFFIAFFNQLSGINFILYYAPEILAKAGLAAKESLFNSIAIGGINLLFTFVGLYLIDRMGRKKLILIGSVGYIISLSMVAWCFYTEASAGLLMTFLLLFIAAHAIGQGAVIWVFIAEIFPNKVRALGQSFGASVHWVFAAIITLITPVFLDEKNGLLKDKPWVIFIFFAGMMLLQLIWAITKMPETKGASLEELEGRIVGP
jgi:sugar porter (SP) family MFS transporter